MKRVLFLDRDGTLVREPEDYQVDRLDKVEFYPEVFRYLSRIARELDYTLVMVTNQDGLGTESFPEQDFRTVQAFILKAFANEGVHFDEILIDRSFPHDNAPTRKPRTGMLTHYLNGEYDLAGSYVIGDRLTDMELARNLGSRGIWLNADPQLGAEESSDHSGWVDNTVALATQRWADIYQFLRQPANRSTQLHRRTKETDIRVELELDGRGRSNHQTGIGFFDHMLDQLAKHSGCNLQVRVTGDLQIDEHHTIEDAAIVLGEAFRQALGDKRGIERYGFYLLPMDESLASVAIDFGGRPWLVWRADFRREKVGGMPTEMFHHFFKSFSDHAGCNLNIEVSGQNEHHMIEAIFKAFARALKMAVRREAGNRELPSTKGSL